MKKRGARPKGKVRIKWSPRFAYAIGLLVSDGCLSSNGRHVVFVSKDTEQIKNFLFALDIQNHVGTNSTKTPRVQFSDVLFYRFLVDIGLMPNKSKIIGSIKVPPRYFFQFLRGIFDGDGSTYSYWDKRWRSSYMFYVCFASASPDFLRWLQKMLHTHLDVIGHITSADGHSTKQLKYAKREGLEVLRRMYHDAPKHAFLKRKHLKITQMLAIVGEQL
jgi:hypothetical protein